MLCFSALSAPERQTGLVERQITTGAKNHILTNTNVWSPDGQWIVYDVRPDAEGTQFESDLIEMVNVQNGQVKTLYQSKNGAHCGVVTWHPHKNRVAFILGPENPTPDWSYGPSHRQGVIVDAAHPGRTWNLDARDLTAPLTPGALRGGSHVHIWHPRGDWFSFTYNDALLDRFKEDTDEHDADARNIAVAMPRRLRVDRDHPRNHDGTHFTVLVTRTKANPQPGSDEIKRAFEEGWIGSNGYLKPGGTRQKRALAFQGEVVAKDGKAISEVFVVDIPDDVTIPSAGPLQGTLTKRPLPPQGTQQRRLTFTADNKYPGLQGPRHWLRSSPNGSQIAFLMRDDTGTVQLWSISPNGGPLRQITHDVWSTSSAFTWSRDGRFIAYIADNSVLVVGALSGQSHRLTPRSDDHSAPLSLACVFSPDGCHIAYLRRVPESSGSAARFNHIFVAALPDSLQK